VTPIRPHVHHLHVRLQPLARAGGRDRRHAGDQRVVIGGLDVVNHCRGSSSIQQAIAAADSSTTSQLLSALGTASGSTDSADTAMASVASESDLWHGIDELA
jgi:hypothetical protein